ncbi:hypothetical protein D1871_11835 [Nakamurella silvestris]|nr:hypothetical protein D1871_11835 [Nakamurella silvestris]
MDENELRVALRLISEDIPDLDRIRAELAVARIARRRRILWALISGAFTVLAAVIIAILIGRSDKGEAVDPLSDVPNAGTASSVPGTDSEVAGRLTDPTAGQTGATNATSAPHVALPVVSSSATHVQTRHPARATSAGRQPGSVAAPTTIATTPQAQSPQDENSQIQDPQGQNPQDQDQDPQTENPQDQNPVAGGGADTTPPADPPAPTGDVPRPAGGGGIVVTTAQPATTLSTPSTAPPAVTDPAPTSASRPPATNTPPPASTGSTPSPTRIPGGPTHSLPSTPGSTAPTTRPTTGPTTSRPVGIPATTTPTTGSTSTARLVLPIHG